MVNQSWPNLRRFLDFRYSTFDFRHERLIFEKGDTQIFSQLFHDASSGSRLGRGCQGSVNYGTACPSSASHLKFG